MRKNGVAFLVVFALAAVCVASLQSAGPTPVRKEPAAKKRSAKLQSLLKERVDVHRKLLKIAEDRHRQAIGSTESVIRASLDLHDAELDLAETNRERVEILKKSVALHRRLERIAMERFRIGAASSEKLHRVKAARLTAEIRLAREQDAE